MVVVGVYVDDLLVTASPHTLVEAFFVTMGTLSVKDLSQVRKFLGMRVQLSDGDGYTLDQQVTIEELLEKYESDEANGEQIPVGKDKDEAEAGEMKHLVMDGLSDEPSIRDF